jgi:hypothetical protein
MSVPIWLTGFPTSLSNRLTWRLSAALAASLALLATILTLRYPPQGHPQESTSLPQTAVAAPAEATPLISNRIETPTGHLDRLIDFCSSMVTYDRSFVVFSNGTCVIVSEPSIDPIAEAVTILGECSNPNARFLTDEIEHGNVLVTYQKPAFHCLFEDEINQTRVDLNAGFTHYLTAVERSQMDENWEPPFHAKLGLVARQRLNEDAMSLRIAKVIKARPVDPLPTDMRDAISLEVAFPEG